MNPAQALPVNHHADSPGRPGLAGIASGALMFAAGGRRARTIVEAAGIRADDRVADIGCGSGVVVRAAAQRGAQVTGIDPSPAILRFARLLVRDRSIRWAEGAAERLPLADSSTTVALAVATVHHWPDVTTALTETRRVMVPGGRFVAAERHSPIGATGIASHGWTGDQARTFAELCRAAGFTDSRVERINVGRNDIWVVHSTRP
ncbi:class I SAM-dependent methyltransferase [Nocardia macrotermitis]|uniref:Ubiquinone/menaquinone biosynthesis C-methyltransferase UbiE n=1 Tax=Nocardia macrotermitis TaxID=2585198 RepID=A0A7K0D867_9NOCA|nr:class I SAM-dependent methyltransferase [Nocardia macrotermitis]MQY21741.1 Ubiquinone/menaquinone biosynthesis C-methyltransferase UbiE [Nocardia macrotermitis]